MLALLLSPALGPMPAHADKIKNGTAVFSGLDKITGRIISFKAAMGETVQFGSLQVTARACFTRPATEAPQTDTFVEVEEVSATKEYKKIFSGWMFAASPGPARDRASDLRHLAHGLRNPRRDDRRSPSDGGRRYDDAAGRRQPCDGTGAGRRRTGAEAEAEAHRARRSSAGGADPTGRRAA